MTDTGFIVRNDTDLVTIFEPGSGGPATNFIGKDGNDLNTRFAPFVSGGTNAGVTGYKVGTTDLSELFMKKGTGNFSFLSSTSVSFTYTGTSITGSVSVVGFENTVTVTPVKSGNTYTITGLSTFKHGQKYQITWMDGATLRSYYGLYVGINNDYVAGMGGSTGDENNKFNVITRALTSYVPRIPPVSGSSSYIGGIRIKGLKINILKSNFGGVRLEGPINYKITSVNDNNNQIYNNNTTEVTPFTNSPKFPSVFGDVDTYNNYFYIRIYDNDTNQYVFSGYIVCFSAPPVDNINGIFTLYELKTDLY